MLEIEQHNPHAFIQGDRSKLKNHARLQIFYHRPNHHLKPQSSQKHRTHHQPTGPSKYRLTQAEMHIISDQDHTSENTLDHASPQKRQNFSDKIIQSRIKALQIQNEVIQLDKKLHQKAYKMQILNHRLAQLQRQLEHKKIGP